MNMTKTMNKFILVLPSSKEYLLIELQSQAITIYLTTLFIWIFRRVLDPTRVLNYELNQLLIPPH